MMGSKRSAPSRAPALFTIIALSGLVTGCVLSIETAVPQAVFQPGLVGTWMGIENNGEDTLRATVTRWGKTGYRIRYTDEDGKSAMFEGRTGRVGNHLVLEVAPLVPEGEPSDAYTDMLLPGRVVFVIALGDDDLRTTALEIDSLRAYLRRHGTSIPSLDAGGNSSDLLLTGTTAELRTWLASYLDRPGVFTDEAVWRRVHG